MPLRGTPEAPGGPQEAPERHPGGPLGGLLGPPGAAGRLLGHLEATSGDVEAILSHHLGPSWGVDAVQEPKC